MAQWGLGCKCEDCREESTTDVCHLFPEAFVLSCHCQPMDPSEGSGGWTEAKLIFSHILCKLGMGHLAPHFGDPGGAWLSAVSAKTESWHFPFLYHVTLTFREIPFVLGVWRSLCLLSASFLIWLQILVYLADLHDGLVWCYNHFPILSQRNGCLTIFSFSWLFLMDFKARKNIKCPIIFN